MSTPLSATKAPISRTARLPLAAWLPLAGFVCLIALRAVVTDHIVAAYTGCQWCVAAGVAHHDLAILALFAALLGIELLLPWRALRWLCRAAAVALLLAYVIDFGLFAALTHRLYLADVLTFGQEGAAIEQFVRALLRRDDIVQWLAVALVVLIMAGVVAWRHRRSKPAGAAALLLAATSLALWLAPLHLAQYVHPEITGNLFEINADNSANRAYSEDFRRKLMRQPAPTPACQRNTQSDQPDVILVLVESLSSYHSKLLGGPLDATPQLDRLAGENHYFTRFVANGYTTNGGRIAAYTGRAPLPPPGLLRTLPLRAYAFRGNTLPELAHEAGYSSHYFTSGNLGFLDSGDWLRGLGFDSVEGAESPFYEGMRRWQFNAADDGALFDRLLAWLDQRRDPRPFLASLLTVSSHPPFVNPETGKIDQIGTFRYVDAQLARFVAALRQRGFFDHGVLMITGDHRSMTPLRREEYRQWGYRALARVPMVVIGDVDMPAVVEQTFAQTDIPVSFAWLAGIPACLDGGHGNFARAQPRPARWVLHSGGARPNRVSVYMGKREYGIVLDGDASRWLDPPPVGGQAILDYINRQRIREARLAQTARSRKHGP